MPRYSICMCNYNMADTLETALGSILSQIDDRFEIILVDDGSSDKSVEVIKNIQARDSRVRLISLPRDPDRKLGFTRNMSIEKAQGDYVLLHLDCDDITGPFIQDFVEVFDQIEKARGSDFLLSGNPIQMGRRDYLLQYGPYRNIHRGEDRDMWSRLAAHNAYLPLHQKSIKTRLPKSFIERLYRAMYYTYDHLRNDFRSGLPLKKFLSYEIRYFKRFSPRMMAFRLMISFPAWLSAKLQGPLPHEKTMESAEDLALYRQREGGNFAQILARYKSQPDWSKFSAAARDIFA